MKPRLPHFQRFVLFAAVGAVGATLHAQMHHVDASEKVTRAVGVYEWTGDIAKPTAARLVPVSLFIEGQFQDAGTYYARPMPLALLNGNVYELEKSGIAQGTFTIDYARHLQAASSSTPDSLTDLGWFGYGIFIPTAAAKKAPALQASRVQPRIVGSKGSTSSDDEEPPTLSRNADVSTRRSDRSQASVTPPAAPADDPDRPHFGRKPEDTSAPDASGASTPQPTTTTTRTGASADDDNDRPTLRRRDPKQPAGDRKAHDEGRVIASAGSLNDDPNRPTMRRGTPAELAGPPKQLSGTPAQLHQLIAVSDAVNREPHDFARPWESPAEQAEILRRMQELARTQLTIYARQNIPVLGAPTPAPAPAHSRAAKRPAATHTAHPAPATATTASLAEEQLRGFTLSYGGLPTFVYTAIAPSTVIGLPDRYVAVVAQRLPSGELQLALTSVTDAAHLDRTPWMRFIDVVDPDASHRASLLFELRARTGRQFALYRILSARAEQSFATNPGE